MGGPSSKAKYSWLTDSEPVPWGKGEKNPGEGSEIEPETVYVQAVEAPSLKCLDHIVMAYHHKAAVKDLAYIARKLRQNGTFEDGVTAYLLYNGSATYIL